MRPNYHRCPEGQKRLRNKNEIDDYIRISGPKGASSPTERDHPSWPGT